MSRMHSVGCIAVIGLLALTFVDAPQAQMARPKAVLVPLAEADGVRAGASVRLALRVTLPVGTHVQSDKPRDPALIPTALTMNVPTGIAVTAITYPEPTDFPQSGQSKPLAVFEQNFVVGIELTVASTLAPGTLTVPGRLRYQACDTQTCYIPARDDVQWTLRVAAPGTPIRRLNADVFDKFQPPASK